MIKGLSRWPECGAIQTLASLSHFYKALPQDWLLRKMVRAEIARCRKYQKKLLDRGTEVAYATDTAIPLPDLMIGCWKLTLRSEFPVSNHAGTARIHHLHG
jgi:hypothetical protein